MAEEIANERWAAIESNPEVLTELCHRLGVSEQFEVIDVYSLDPEMLAFVPQPVLALFLLFPSRDEDGERTRPKFKSPEHRLSKEIFFLEQCKGHLDNACGTIAVVHSILNNRDILGLTNSSSPLENFYQKTKDLDFHSRGLTLDGDTDLAAIHNSMVTLGQSRPLSSAKICHHFVCFVDFEGHATELDGANNEGPHVFAEMKDGESFLDTAAQFIKAKYIERSGGNIQFSLMGLVLR